jgi:hypothetical protein
MNKVSSSLISGLLPEKLANKNGMHETYHGTRPMIDIGFTLAKNERLWHLSPSAAHDNPFVAETECWRRLKQCLL